MSLRLSLPDAELRQRFQSLKTARDLALLLDVKYSTLIFYAVRNQEANYQSFKIPKKSGGERVITAPVTPLKILQRKLAQVLTAVYRVKPAVHGFTRDRSIITNAHPHVAKNLIFNLDLENFFPSIHFGRVRGIFLKKPFELPAIVATTIAQLCCYQQALPQGAPSSPILSSLACRNLDRALQALAKRTKCIYTRYADDISFSTNRNSFPSSIAIVDEEGDGRVVSVGEELAKLIKDNGFRINQQKVLYRTRAQRQLVTGLVVNAFPNVRRTFIRRIRAMLHSWDKLGLDQAARAHFARHAPGKVIQAQRANQLFRRGVAGRLNFLKQVRGDRCRAYQILAIKYATLNSRPIPQFKPPEAGRATTLPAHPVAERLRQYVWVVQCEQTAEQGTAFMLDGIGLITNHHVIENMLEPKAFLSDDFTKQYEVEEAFSNRTLKHYDLAVLRFKNTAIDQQMGRKGIKPLLRAPVDYNEQIYVLGFPGYSLGDPPQTSSGHILSPKRRFGWVRWIVSARITSGMSGGPVVNRAGGLIGVAVTGDQAPSGAEGSSSTPSEEAAAAQDATVERPLAEQVLACFQGLRPSVRAQRRRKERLRLRQQVRQEVLGEVHQVLRKHVKSARYRETYEHAFIPIDDVLKALSLGPSQET